MPSVFSEYFHPPKFADRFVTEPGAAVDVIIPVAHTNELWRSNLLSIYREIPVRRLLLGDGGCVDQTIDVAKTFPRVEVLDHRSYVSLGFSIRKLIEAVESEWFVYLHSDVFLPPGWYDTMRKHQSEFDWFECRQHLTVLVDYPLQYGSYDRPLSGSQMGRREAFKDILPVIEDDYLYRNEDLVLADLVTARGRRYGRVDETFHYHQVMNKASAHRRNITGATLTIDKSREEEVREFTMHIKGLIKYVEPRPLFIQSVQQGLDRLLKLKALDYQEFSRWVATTNPRWSIYIRRPNILRRVYRRFRGL